MDQQLISLGNKLFDSIKYLFPKHAEFCYQYDGGKTVYICRVKWKLNTDPSRPNKPSKIILISLSEEDLADYKDSSSQQQQTAQERFKKFVESKCKTFEPDHDVPKNQTPPKTEWFMTNLMG